MFEPKIKFVKIRANFSSQDKIRFVYVSNNYDAYEVEIYAVSGVVVKTCSAREGRVTCGLMLYV